MRVVLWWKDGLVLDEPEIVLSLRAADYEVRLVRNLQDLGDELPSDPGNPAMVVTFLDCSGPGEDYDRRVREIWGAYRPLRETRPIGLILVVKRGSIIKSFPHPWWAAVSLPADVATLVRFIRRFDEAVRTAEGREEARRQGSL